LFQELAELKLMDRTKSIMISYIIRIFMRKKTTVDCVSRTYLYDIICWMEIRWTICVSFPNT